MVAVQVRDVPVEIRDALAAEAAERGQSLQAFLLQLLADEAAVARNRRLLAEWARTPLIDRHGEVDVAALIREGREERDEAIRTAIGKRST